jgi:outer membrane protein TolC
MIWNVSKTLDGPATLRSTTKHFIAAKLLLLLCSCTSNAVDDLNPNSEIARGVQEEYRRFVSKAEGELGPHVADKDGNVTRAARSDDPYYGVSRVPPKVEGLPIGKASAGAYWEKAMTARQSRKPKKIPVEIDQLLGQMLATSNQLAASSDIPMIREAVVNEEEGRFSPYAFGEGSYKDTDTPRSSLLQTGTSSSSPTTLKEDEGSVEFGLGQPLITGGELRLSQRLGRRDSNSEFFVPKDQADAKLRLEFKQPLLRGAGVEVNSAPMQLARLERDRSVADFQRQIEDQFSEVVRAYWTLYAERARVLQRQRLVGELQSVAGRISARKGLDTLTGEAEQATASIRSAEASIIRARTGADNSQARLSSLLSDKALYGDEVEVIPTQRPAKKFIDVPLEDVALLAVQNRPELKAVALQLRSAELQERVAKNNLLPDLDLFAGVSNDGLAGNNNYGDAWQGQWDQTDVDVDVGVRLKVPLGNTSEKAQHERRRIELRQLTSQMRNVSDTVLLEAQIAVREVRSAYQEMKAREAELSAVSTEIGALQARSDEGLESGSAFLATLISGLEDRTQAEERLMEATVTYNLALYALERAAGTMLTVRGIQATRIASDDLDYIRVSRQGYVSKDADASPNGSDKNILVNPQAIRKRDAQAEAQNAKTAQD